MSSVARAFKGISDGCGIVGADFNAQHFVAQDLEFLRQPRRIGVHGASSGKFVTLRKEDYSGGKSGGKVVPMRYRRRPAR